MNRFSTRLAVSALGAAFLLLSCVIPAPAGFFGGKKKKSKKRGDPFSAVHKERMEAMRARPVVHAPVKEGKCSSCHASPKSPKKLVLEYKPLCLSCHKERAADLNKASVHAIFKDGDCDICHEPHASDRPALLNADGKQLCVMCHSVEDDPVRAAHGGVTAFDGECFSCHSPHGSARAKLIKDGRQHNPFRERSCEICHDEPGKDGKAAVKESLSDACFMCHSDIKDLAGKKVVHAPFAGGMCASCHNPHVARRPGLLKGPAQDVCRSCHDDIPDRNHPVVSHPTFKEGKMDPRRKDKPFDCASCHNPHGSDHLKLLSADTWSLCGECHKK